MIIEGIALTPTEDVQGTNWPEDVLRDSAESLDGVPVVENFGSDPDTVGEVTEAEYRDGEGIWYRADVDEADHGYDPEILSMAPSVTFGSPVVDEEEETITPQGLGFEAMAPVSEATEAVGDHEVISDAETG